MKTYIIKFGIDSLDWDKVAETVKIKAKEEAEAIQEVIDAIYFETDEAVWVQDGFPKGEEGFDKWIDSVWRIEVTEISQKEV